MSTDEKTARRMEDKARLKAFWEGPMDEPYIMERINFHCDCDVFLPTVKSRIGLVVRSAIMRASRMIPPSRLKRSVLRLTGMKIGRDVYVSPEVVIDPLWPWLVEIGDGVIIGLGCRILSHECTVKHFRIGLTRIGRQSVIGAGSTIRAGVTIGARVTVGCNSYVNSDIPDDWTVGGVPAKPLAQAERK